MLSPKLETERLILRRYKESDIDILKKENPDLRIYLGASKGKEGFYERFGFIKRIDANLGYGMILN